MFSNPVILDFLIISTVDILKVADTNIRVYRVAEFSLHITITNFDKAVTGTPGVS
jgi:hypothetical protein